MSIKWSYSLFWTFETSAVADLCYHLCLFLLADDHKGCSGVFVRQFQKQLKKSHLEP